MLLALLLFGILVFLMLSYYFTDIQINKYENMQQVKEDNAMQKGWVPANLPESAYNISETHDIDNNQLFGSFYYKEDDEEQILKGLVLHKDMNDTYVWEGFLFKINRKINKVKYRNDPDSNHTIQSRTKK